MPILPPRILNGQVTAISNTDSWTVDDGTGDPWIGYPYRWQVTMDVTPQSHSSHVTPTPYVYSAADVKVGDWIADIASGSAVRINSFVSQNTQALVAIVEDVDRFNTFTDPTGNGNGIGSAGSWMVFQIADDGLPILGPLSSAAGAIQTNVAFQMDQISRFRYRNYLRTHNAVNQAAHGFVLGDLIRMTSSGTYAKATASMTAAQIVGSVSDIGIPGADWFSYRPVGRIVTDLPALPGAAGSLVYVGMDGSLTATKPTAWAKPVYIRLETATKGIVLDRSVDGVSTNGWSSQTYVVDSLAARNALTNLNPGDQVMVKDMGNGEWTHYLYEMGGTWVQMVTQDASNTDSYSKQANITYQSDPNGVIATVSDGRRVDEVVIEVTQAFDGNATLSVGTMSDNGMLMSIDQNDLSMVGNYKVDPAHIFNTNGADTAVKYYLTTNGTNTGAATVSITYS